MKASVFAALLCALALTAHAADVLTPLELTSKTFKPAVEDMKMPWIISFAAGNTVENEEAVELSNALDGYARVGTVDTSKEQGLLKHLGLTKETAPSWRLYFYGERSNFKDFKTAAEAKEALLAALPTNLVAVATSPEALQEYFISSLNTAMVPCVLFSEGSTAPPLLQKLAMWFPQVKFVSVLNPSPEFQKNLNVQRLPQLQVMIAVPDESAGPNTQQRVGIQSFPYDRTKFGGLKFKNAAHYIAQAEYELRKMNLWPDPKKQQQAAPEPTYDGPLAEVFEITSNTTDVCPPTKLGLCVIALLDGSPDNADKEAQIEILRKVQAAPSSKGRVLHFMWVDVRCHPGFGAVFDVRADSAPTVVAIAPKKSRFAHMLTVYDADKIAAFIGGVLSGKTPTAPFKEFPAVDGGEDCVALYATLAAPPAADEFDLSDIMSEDVGADPRAAVEKDAEAARLAAEQAAEDAEKAAKERIAREEVERLNKKTKKKTKKSKAKTEL